jgi:hypothetical protein
MNQNRDVEVLKHWGLQKMAQKYGFELQFPADVNPLNEKQWRDKAEETRRLAKIDSDPVVKQGLRNIARAYERMADFVR